MRLQHLNRTTRLPNKHRFVGRGEKLVFAELGLGLDQDGGTIAETYVTNGIDLVPSLKYVGLIEAEQVFGLAPMYYGEAIGGTEQGVSLRWDKPTRKLLMFRTENSNNELANGVSIALITLKLLILGN